MYLYLILLISSQIIYLSSPCPAGCEIDDFLLKNLVDWVWIEVEKINWKLSEKMHKKCARRSSANNFENGNNDHPETIRLFLVSLILRSNKTTISVATGHTCYWPLYLSIGNIHNNICHGHQNGVILLGFLAIPKSRWFDFQFISWCAYSFNPADNKSWNDINYQKFHHQLLHSLLQMILKPIRPYMTSSKIICCPDGHYHWAIFSLGPYIADYPKQCLLASIVQGWCPTYAKLYSSCLHTSDILCFRCNAPSIHSMFRSPFRATLQELWTLRTMGQLWHCWLHQSNVFSFFYIQYVN